MWSSNYLGAFLLKKASVMINFTLLALFPGELDSKLPKLLSLLRVYLLVMLLLGLLVSSSNLG
jgi:hypothetical protein